MKKSAFGGRAAAALRQHYRTCNRLIGVRHGAVLLRAVTPLVVRDGMTFRQATAKLIRDLRRVQRGG